MIEEIMKKLGYVKEKEIDPFDYLPKIDKDVLRTISLARASKCDLFIDYVLNTGTQKFYMKEKGSKKSLLKLEL